MTEQGGGGGEVQPGGVSLYVRGPRARIGFA